MTEACDPDADIETLRKAIKMQTGEELKLTRKEMCDAYNNISGGKIAGSAEAGDDPPVRKKKRYIYQKGVRKLWKPDGRRS